MEEPDSPSSLQRALVGLESDKPISPRLPNNPLMGQAEVGLSNIFNLFLSLKRKHGEESKESPPLKKSNLAIRDVDSALIALPPSTLVISPPNFSPAKPNSSKSSKGRYVKGGEGIRRSPRRKGIPLSRPSHLRRVEVNVAQEIDYPSDRVNRDIECEEALFDDDSQSGIVSRASVAGPNQPRVQW